MGRPLRIKCKSREEWLARRSALHGIGGSDCAAILGASPWKTVNDLWQEKTGQKQPKDVSNDPFVQKGVRLEKPLRELFKSVHPEYKVYHEPFDIWYQKERPWSFATLDGRIRTADKKLGVLEIKTSTPNGSAGWAEWSEKIPTRYYLQCLHQVSCIDADFVILYACLFNRDSDYFIREYRFEREDIQADMDYLLEKEEEFWKSVQSGALPPMRLIL